MPVSGMNDPVQHSSPLRRFLMASGGVESLSPPPGPPLSSFAGDAPVLEDAELEASVAQILESLRVLDDHTEALEAYDAAAEDEPDWLMQATAAVKHISAVPVSPAVPPALGERQITWDEKAATVQFEITSAGGMPNMDVGALAWIDAQLVPIVARSFPHLARLVTSPDNDADTAEDYARELLKKRDALLLRKRHVRDEVVQRSAVGAVAAELRKEEHEAHLLRIATVKQASSRHTRVTRPYRLGLDPRPKFCNLRAPVGKGTVESTCMLAPTLASHSASPPRCAPSQTREYAALRDQLDATMEVARATSEAARTIFDEHLRDVQVMALDGL